MFNTRQLHQLGPWVCIGALALIPTLSFAADKSSFSPTKLITPKGPGSITGVGENIELSSHMGQATYGVDFDVPTGYDSLSVKSGLSYSAGNGNGPVGIGWSLNIESIDRRTVDGVPSYSERDTFAANSTRELVETSRGIYRQRYEGAFIRYTYDRDRDTWKAEYPDGTIGYFGATRSGDTVELARVQDEQGRTGRYLLHEKTDPRGHLVRYTYSRDGANRLLSKIEYVFGDRTTSRYSIQFGYELRPDLLVDARFGFAVPTTRRLRDVTVFVGDQQRRRYLMTYQEPSLGRSVSLLDSVTTYGRDNVEPYPARYRFGYTGALPNGCTDLECLPVRLVTMNTPALRQGLVNADLVDLNGDAIPDLLDTAGGAHQILIGKYEPSQHTFQAAIPTDLTGQGASELASPTTTMIDIDGDQDADFLDLSNGRVLLNSRTGDWDAELAVDSTNMPRPDQDANLRFVDIDHDKRIDALHAGPDGAYWYQGLGDGRFGEAQLAPTTTSASFTSGLKLADVNGDGIQDWVELLDGVARYREHRGRLDFSEWRELPGAPAHVTSTMRLADMDGDGLADIVDPSGTSIMIWLGQGERGFTGPLTLTQIQGQPLPNATAPGTNVRLADMNANGTTDVVYFPTNGPVQYLEIFTTKPNLLERVDNTLGKIVELEYSTAADEMARDSGRNAWTYKLSIPVQVVSKIRTFDTLSGVEQVKRIRYRDGFYDGSEQQFRGFSQVEIEAVGDAAVETGTTLLLFDVGQTDRYRHGKQLAIESYSAGRLLERTTTTYDDCPLADIRDSLEPAVRHVCAREIKRELLEGLDESEGVEITTQMETDGYGQVIIKRELGVTSRAGQGCAPCDHSASEQGAPCGVMCLGDELVTRTTYVEPGLDTSGLWVLGKPIEVQRHALTLQDAASVERFFYDGEDFVGSSAGKLTRGELTRRVQKADEQIWIELERHRFGEHGQIVETLDAEGARTRFTYDDDGILLQTEALELEGLDGPYELEVRATYDAVHELVTELYQTRLVSSTGTLDPQQVTRYGYDRFGRMSYRADPGDSLENPTHTWTYDVADPISRIVQRSRSVQNGPLDTQEITCIDGLGRVIQKRYLLAPNLWSVREHRAFGADGEPITEWREWSTSDEYCSAIAPPDAPAVNYTRDARGRVLQTVLPDTSTRAIPSFERTEYRPLTRIVYDAEDTDPSSPHYNTPTLEYHDGLARLVRVERTAGEETKRVDILYDGLGHAAGFKLDGGYARTQRWDLAGRLVEGEDPDRGRSRYAYNARGERVKATDARGVVQRREYDEAGRLRAEWIEGERDTMRRDYIFDRDGACSTSSCARGVGQLVRQSYVYDDMFGEDTYTYDTRARLQSTVRTIDSLVFAFRSERDNLGRIVAREYPDGRRVETEFDAAGRVVRVPGFIEDVLYDERGQVHTLLHANGVRETYAHDSLGRLERLSMSHQQGPTLFDRAYQRDRVGNILSIADLNESTGSDDASAQFELDDFYRLRRAEFAPNDPNSARVYTYTYDLLDRLLRKSSQTPELGIHSTSMSYDTTRHIPSKAGDIPYTLDGAGNVIERASISYDWDGWGHLRTIGVLGQEQVHSSYGPENKRLRKVEGGLVVYYPHPDYEIRDGQATIFVSAGGSRLVKWTQALDTVLVEKIAPSQTLPGKFTSADALLQYAHDVGRMNHEYSTSLSGEQLLDAAATQSLDDYTHTGIIGERVHQHFDHQGSRVMLTNSSGDVLERMKYAPFGEPIAPEPLTFGYTGMEHEVDNRHVQFDLRPYHARMGHWLRPDPMFERFEPDQVGGSWEFANPYRYGQLNPLNTRDASGGIAPLVFAVIATKALVSGVIDGAIEASQQYIAHKSGPDANQPFRPNYSKVAFAAGVGTVFGAIPGKSVHTTVNAIKLAKNTSRAKQLFGSGRALVGHGIKSSVNREKAIEFAGDSLINYAESSGHISKEVSDVYNVAKFGTGLTQKISNSGKAYKGGDYRGAVDEAIGFSADLKKEVAKKTYNQLNPDIQIPYRPGAQP